MTEERRDLSWALCHSGARFYFCVGADLQSIRLEDIAHNLSRICRFGGATSNIPYSVAQHSVYHCAVIREQYGVTDRNVLLRSLLHDASEAYLGDPHPGVKEAIPQLADLHKRVQNRIFERFKIQPVSDEMESLIKTVDLRLLKTEFRDLFPNSPNFWEQVTGYDEFEFKVIPVDWQRAKQEFLAFFELLSA